MPILPLMLAQAALAAPHAVDHRLVQVTTHDGHELVGRLALPADAEGPVPVIYYVPGSGPWTYDRPIPVPTGNDDDPVRRSSWTAQLEQLAVERGMGLFNLSKRGCTLSGSWPWEQVDREVFGAVTHQDLVEDLVAGLEALRQEPDVDAQRLMLMGGSEGTLTGPRMVAAAGEGFVGAALYGYVEYDGEHVTVWQNSLGAFRNVAWRLDADRNQRITRDEWKHAPDEWPPALFDLWDHDRDGAITSSDMVALNRGRLKLRLRKLRQRDDDWHWENLLKLNTAFLLEEWHRPPNHLTLLQLDVPIGIFHGEYDGNVPVEGALSAAMAFEEAGRDDLHLRVVPGASHSLHRPDEDEYGMGQGKTEMFDWLASLLDH